jgi:DNA-binding MarR family transcriptional regulator
MARASPIRSGERFGLRVPFIALGGVAALSLAFCLAVLAAPASAMPNITIYSPALNPTVTNNPSLLVTGFVDPPNSTVNLNGAPASVDAGGNVSVQGQLFEGANILTLTATDWLLESANDSVEVILDTVAPYLILSAPLDTDTLTNHPAFLVSGQTESPNISVALNGIAMTVDLQSEFSYNYTLADGLNVLRFTATDAARNALVLVRQITFDRYAPFLQVDAPVNGLLTNGLHLDVLGRTERDANLTVNGVVAFVNPIDGTFILNNATLDSLFDQTENLLVIKAVDPAGNARFENRTVIVDTKAPTITLRLDADIAGALAAGRTVAVRQIDVKGTTDTADAVILVGGQQAAMNGLNFSRTYILAEGLNLIIVRARDAAGNVATFTLQLRVDWTPPSLAISSPPAAQFATNQTSLEVRGFTDSPDAVAALLYDDLLGVPTTDTAAVTGSPGSYEFSFLLTLNPDRAPHAVVLRLRDLAGNTAAQTFIYSCLTGEPLLEIISITPSPGEPFVWINGTTQAGIDAVEINGQPFQVYGQYFAVRYPALDWGTTKFTVRIVDAAGNENVQTRNVQITVGTSLIFIVTNHADPAPLVAGDLTEFSLGADTLLPPGANISWFLDGVPVGTGRNIGNVVLAAGDHNLTVTIANATWHATSSETVHVAPSGVAALGASSAVWISLALIGLVGAALSGTEVGRYFVIFAALGAILGRGKPSSPLDHFVRGRLYQVISEDPGIHYSELRRRAKLSNGSAAHHLHVLERASLIRVVVDGSRTRFYPTDRALDDDSYGLTEADRAVLTTATAAPGLSEGEISQRLERSLSTVSRSVDRLGVLGLVTTRQDGRRVSVFPRAGAEAPTPPAWPRETD